LNKRTPFIVRTIRNHTPQEINYASQKTISYSQFSIYNECPHKWKLLYKDGLQEYQPTIHTVFGTAMHNSIQHYITMMYEESGAAADRFDLEGLFEEEFGKTYREEYTKNKKTHFSDPVEMREFYDDGINIINYFKKNKGKYFSKRGWHLIGCELPIVLNPNPQYPSILYKGYLDLVLYNEDTDKHKIIDFKTSTRGWNADTKKDEGKQFQLLFYKEYYSKQYNVDKDNIDVEFIILKRKIWEESEFPQSRIQEFAPPDGKIKMNRAMGSMGNFIEQCFNNDGSFKDTNHPITPNKNCQWCPFNNNKELCNK
jgi:hypothetical protein